MRPLRTLIIGLLSVSCFQITLRADKLELEDAFKKKWAAIKLTFYHDGGDYVAEGPCIFLQRLPDKRTLLSYAEGGVGEKLPLAERFISVDEASQIISQVNAFWAKARTELSARERLAKLPPAERETLRKKSGTEEFRIKIQISKFNQRDDDGFEKTVEESAGPWIKFLMNTAGVNP